MTPQETNSGMAIAELNNIPTYKMTTPRRLVNLNTQIQERTYLNRRGNGTNQLRERDTKELREYDREQLEPSPPESFRSGSKPGRVNHQHPVHDRADDRVGDLGQELRDGEHLGRVESAVGFSDERT